MWWRRKPSDFSAEIEAHLQLETEQLQAEGMSAGEAQSEARRAFGNRASSEERFHDERQCMFFDQLLLDIRFAARVLFKDLRFTLLAIIGLGLGLGISSAIFTVMNFALESSDSAEARDPKSYAGLFHIGPGDFSYSDIRYFRDHATLLRSVGATSGREHLLMAPLHAGNPGAQPEEVQARFVSANFLSVLGLQPARGRSFTIEEERGGGASVAMLNFGFWTQRFAGDPALIGKTILLNAHPVTIVGIADQRKGIADPSDFYLPLGIRALLRNQPASQPDADRWLMANARMRPGVTASQAQAEMDVLASALRNTSLARRNAADPADGGVFVSPGDVNPGKARDIRAIAIFVPLAVSMILLIACSNLANLLLARVAVRRREIGVRLSLGAGRARLIRQLLTESLLLSLAGGAIGLLLSTWLAKALAAPLGARGMTPHLDTSTLLFGIALSLAAGFSFGLAPAIAATKTNLAQALHADGLDGNTRVQSWKIWSPRNALVVVPLAASLMLLMGAGLAVRSIERIYLNRPAFDAAHLLDASFRLSMQGYTEVRERAFLEDLRARVAATPGVGSVAVASAMPLSNGMGWFSLRIEGAAIQPQDAMPHSDFNVVSPEFFATLGAGAVRGRLFTQADRAGSAPVAIVNREFVHRYWPAEEPIGKRIRLAEGGSALFDVVGVAPDFQRDDLYNQVRPTVYLPYGQGGLFFQGARLDRPPEEMQFLIRAAGEAVPAVKSAVRQQALALDASLRVDVQTLQEQRDSHIVPFKTISMLLTALGALALLMASIGIYAILAYAVSQRTREIGIRMALGAPREKVLALVIRRMLVLIAWGVGFGFLGTQALQRILSKLVAELGGFDLATYLAPALLLGTVAMLASYLPARKALRVDPIEALRCE